MIATFISDTQGMNIPFQRDGDVLIHCGDFYEKGACDPKLDRLNGWLRWHRYRYRFFVPGEADVPVLRDREAASRNLTEATLLDGRFVEVEGVRIFGASMLGLRESDYGFRHPEQSEALLATIPQGLDILATHLPPLGVLDHSKPGNPAGCPLLRKAVKRIKPKIHAFGHDTGSNGYRRFASTLCCNVAQNFDVSMFPMPLTMEIQPRCK